MSSSGAVSLPDSFCKLPPELWARILTFVERTPDLSTDEWLAEQAAFWQVPLVCKTFRQIFTQHRIGRHVCIRTEFIPYSVLPSLMTWLQAKSGVIETLQTTLWSPQTDECFSALYPSSTLTSVIVTAVANLEVLAHFTALRCCHLTSPPFQRRERTVANLDLAPLQGLEQLTGLHLASGAYGNLAASQLTYLGLTDAEAHVKEGYSFRPNLIKLTMVSSSLYNVDSKGSLACTALQGLHIGGECVISAKKGEDIASTLVPVRRFHETPAILLTVIDYNMSSLTALKEVEFEASGRASSATITKICKLPSINHLDVLFGYDFEANSDFEHLTQITHLSMRTTDGCKCLRLGFDWMALKALQCLHIQACFVADEDMLRIAHLQRIQHVSLGNLYPIDDASGDLLAQLRQSLGQHKLITYTEFLIRRKW